MDVGFLGLEIVEKIFFFLKKEDETIFYLKMLNKNIKMEFYIFF